jgi:Galactose oxidase, central domain
MIRTRPEVARVPPAAGPTPRILVAAFLVVAIVLLSMAADSANLGAARTALAGAGFEASADRATPISASSNYNSQSSPAAGGGAGSPTTTPPGSYGGVMAYDAKDHYTVLFGGYDGSSYLRETWTFAAGTWTQLTPAVSPPLQDSYAMAYDAKDGYIVLLDDNQTWKFVGGTWTQLTPTRAPSPRFGESMTYDAADGYVLLFGGTSAATGAFLSDTWKFVGGTWTKIAATTHPSARAFVSLAYDAADGYVVLFGGCTGQPMCYGGHVYADTWEYLSGSWTKLAPSTHPSARLAAVMAYDANDGYVVLFGGCPATDCTSPVGGTWEFLGGEWTELAPLHQPAKRGLSVMAYDTKSKSLILFGGEGYLGSALGDTWKFSGGAWTKI